MFNTVNHTVSHDANNFIGALSQILASQNRGKLIEITGNSGFYNDPDTTIYIYSGQIYKIHESKPKYYIVYYICGNGEKTISVNDVELNKILSVLQSDN
jgi:hypothetical protein